MLRLGTYEKGVYVLTAKDMKHIENDLFNAKVEIETAQCDILGAKDHIGDDKFDNLKYANRHAEKTYRILERLYIWMELYMLR